MARAAANGSVKTACRSLTLSGTINRFRGGRLRYSANAPSPANAERRSIRTMARIFPAAKIALAAAHVDLSHDASSDLRSVGRLLDDPDKLVPERAAKLG